LGNVLRNFPLGKVTDVREFHAVIALGKPLFLTLRRGGEIDRIG
jgi:hypothetical protein